MQTSFLTLAAAWDTFRETTLPADAPDVQVECCRIAFYAGAASFQNVLATGVPKGPQVTPEGVRTTMALMSGLQGEILDFARRHGHATH